MSDFENFIPEWALPYFNGSDTNENDIKEYQKKLTKFWNEQDGIPEEYYY